MNLIFSKFGYQLSATCLRFSPLTSRVFGFPLIFRRGVAGGFQRGISLVRSADSWKLVRDRSMGSVRSSFFFHEIQQPQSRLFRTDDYDNANDRLSRARVRKLTLSQCFLRLIYARTNEASQKIRLQERLHRRVLTCSFD